MKNHNPDLNAAKHHLADRDDLPNLAARLVELVDGRVVIEYVEPEKVTQADFDDEGNYKGDAPHDVLATSWNHPNVNGVLTKEQFDEDLDRALRDMVERIVECGKWRAYPMRHKPPTTYGRAYHDFQYSMGIIELNEEDLPVSGHEFPIDVRIVIEYGQIPHEDDVLNGLKFHVVTLLEKGSYEKHNDEDS